MANSERGEVEVIVNDRPYTLKLSTNVAIAFEEQHKKTIGQLVAEASALNFKSIRYFLWLLLQAHHKEDFKGLGAVGQLIDDAGGIAIFLAKIQAMVEIDQQAQQAALREAKQTKGAALVNPPEAQAEGDGAGEPSIAMPVE